MAPIAVVLYEDQATALKDFGLHNLVLACVLDEVTFDRSALGKKLSGQPMNGVDKLLTTGWKGITRLAPQGQPVFALIDEDKIRKHVKVPPTADEDAVVQAIQSKCTGSSRFEVFLLRKNTETVIETAALCSDQIPKDAIERAIQKVPNARDRVLNIVAWGLGRAVRDCIRGKVPALDRLVKALCAVVAASPA